jgi:hypothetical protein
MYLSLLCASKISSKEGVKLFYFIIEKEKLEYIKLHYRIYTLKFQLIISVDLIA